MSKIKNFWIMCLKCKEKSTVNMEFLGKKTFMFKCYHCGSTEVVTISGLPPIDEEDFISQNDTIDTEKLIN